MLPLNLDLGTILVDALKDTTEGQTFITNCSGWNDAAHKKYPPPLTIFMRFFLSVREPELLRSPSLSKASTLLPIVVLECRCPPNLRLSLSGVIMSTIYRQFDLDYKLYVISDNVLELLQDHNREFSKVIPDAILPKMNLEVISVDEALQTPEQFS